MEVEEEEEQEEQEAALDARGDELALGADLRQQAPLAVSVRLAVVRASNRGSKSAAGLVLPRVPVQVPGSWLRRHRRTGSRGLARCTAVRGICGLAGCAVLHGLSRGTWAMPTMRAFQQTAGATSFQPSLRTPRDAAAAALAGGVRPGPCIEQPGA